MLLAVDRLMNDSAKSGIEDVVSVCRLVQREDVNDSPVSR